MSSLSSVRASALDRSWSAIALTLGLVACGASEDGAGSDQSGGANGGTNASGGQGQAGKAASSGGAGDSSTGGAGGSTPNGGGGIDSAGKGGTTASGGSGGSGGGPTHTVGKCDGLGEVGVWEEISPPDMIKEVPFIGASVALVDPNNAGTMYLTTGKSGVYKTIDCGASWEKTNTGRNGDQLDKGAIWSAALDPVDPDTLYALTGYGPSGLWKTTNGGVDWDNIMPTDLGMPGFVARVSMDPTDYLHVLINFHDNCTNGHTPVCFGETKDGGETWEVLDFPTSLKDWWGEGTFILPMDETHWIFEHWQLYYTGDAGKTWVSADTGVSAIQGPFFKAPDGTYYLASAQGITSSPDGEHWAKIPDSGFGMDGIVGCGDSLYGVVGFGAPTTDDYVFTATYEDPTKWSTLATPGLPQPVSSGSNSIACDEDHHVVYAAAQGAGFWRFVAE